MPVEVTLIEPEKPPRFSAAALSGGDGRFVAPARSPSRSVTLYIATKILRSYSARLWDFDKEKRLVRLSGSEEIGYDYLIVAAGARHSYFGHDEWEAEAPGLKTLEDAVEIRRRVLMAFELAEREAYLTGVKKPLISSSSAAARRVSNLPEPWPTLPMKTLAKDFMAIEYPR